MFRMRRAAVRSVVGAVVLAGVTACESLEGIGSDDTPAAPRDLQASYHAGVVHLTWELPPQWNGEPFRIYAKRTSDQTYFLIAEVTNCISGLCSFSDVNVVVGATYLYYVASVSRSGVETPTATSVQVAVPQPTPPAVPSQIQVVALDAANYVRWGDNARAANDFSHYRVWLSSQGTSYLLGETDSEGFLDLRAENGLTYTYFVTSVDAEGHESPGSAAADGTPRPDYHAEWLYDYFQLAASSGFRFQESDQSNPIVSGTSPSRHFRFEVDDGGWWLVPGPNTSVYPNGFATTALKCGVGADAECAAVERAPTSGYAQQDLGLSAQTTYVLRVRGDDGQMRYGAIRVQLLGYDGSSRPIMIFDWAYQLQVGNANLAPGLAAER
jgi:hypothetical protein